MTYTINFIASAIGIIYENMIPPYIYFALKNNKNAHVEVIVEDKDIFYDRYRDELNNITKLYGHNFLVRNFSRQITYHMLNTYRFLEVPFIKAKYTYICDVDIMLLEDIVSPYLLNWPSKSQPYNNIVRKNTEKITGVHFVITDEYYTDALKNNQEVLYNSPYMNDEKVLYILCKLTFGEPDYNHSWRPILGIHFSPNRGDNKTMYLLTSYKYRDIFLTYAKEPIFKYKIFHNLVKSLNTDFRFGSRTFYSALFTDKNKPCDTIQSFERIENWDYILFTNLDITSDSWTIRKIELPDPNYIISAKMIKWLSHKYLSEYDIVYWMDAYCLFNNTKKEILENNVLKLETAQLPLFIKEHPSRNCIYDEVDACLEYKKIDLDTHTNVIKFLNKHNAPRDYGLYETNSILKMNNNKIVMQIGKELIDILKKLTYRDQLILTYILFKHKIKNLVTLDSTLLTCDGKNAKHSYIKDDPRKVAICFFGLTRSLKYTLPSIKQYLFEPLKKNNIKYEIFLHTYAIKGAYTNQWAGEHDIVLDKNEYKLLKPDHYIIEDKDEVSEKLELEKYRTHGDPWNIKNKWNFNTLNNHILYLWSQKQLTKMVSMKKGITHIVICRPDVRFMTPLDPKWFRFTTDSIFVPEFASYNYVNDQFAIGRYEQMMIYASRFDHALEYSKNNSLISEAYLEYTLNKNKISHTDIEFYYVRVRANNKKVKLDIRQIMNRVTRKKRNLSTKTRKHLRNIINKL
jgi:hypothetical protein